MLPSVDPFESFPARPYLEKYYSYVGDENAAMLNAIAGFTRNLEPRLERVVEVGGGPSVVPILALCAATARSPQAVTFMDISSANIREAKRWVRGASNAFEYAAVLDWLAHENLPDAGQIERLARACKWTLPVLDLRTPLPKHMIQTFDTVSSHFFAESATNDRRTLITLLERIADLGAHEARIYLSFMRRSVGYTVGGIDFPAVAVDEETLPGLFEAAGLCLGDMEILVTPVEVPPTRPGYEGMVFVGGVLQRENNESKRVLARAAARA